MGDAAVKAAAAAIADDDDDGGGGGDDDDDDGGGGEEKYDCSDDERECGCKSARRGSEATIAFKTVWCCL